VYTIDAVEKFVFNAARGSVYLPAPTKLSAVFFRANANTCNTFFNRIRSFSNSHISHISPTHTHTHNKHIQRLKLVHASVVSDLAVDILNNGCKYVQFTTESLKILKRTFHVHDAWRARAHTHTHAHTRTHAHTHTYDDA
jgi:hypothetical protein